MASFLQLNEFFVEGKNRGDSHVLLHITEPTTPEETQKGYFFALAEINGGSVEQIEQLEKLIDDAESGYYASDEAPEAAFEEITKHVNRRSHHILGARAGQVHCMVGVISDSHILFAHHGHMEGRLLYESKNGATLMHVVDDENEEAGDQLFSAVLEGHMNPGDSFIVMTPRVAEYFPDDRLEKLLLGRTSRQTVEHMQKVLSDLGEHNSFGGIIFHLPEKSRAALSRKEKEMGTTDSIAQWEAAKKATEEVLSPPLFGSAKKKMGSLFAREKQRERRRRAPAHAPSAPAHTEPHESETNHRPRTDAPGKQSFLNAFLVTLGRAIVVGATGAARLVSALAVGAARAILMVFLFVTNKDRRRKEVADAARASWKRKKDAFATLPLLSKILFFGMILFGLFFAGSIAYLKINERMEAARIAQEQLLRAITDKKDAAQARLIYDETDTALTLLREARNLIATLPEELKPRGEELQKEIDKELEGLRKLTRVTPTVVGSVSQTYPDAHVTDLAVIDDTLLAFGPEDNHLYVIDPATKQVAQKDIADHHRLHAASTPKENDTVVFDCGSLCVAIYDKTQQTLSQKQISFPDSETKEIAALFVYNQRLYTLAPSASQIYRHAKTQTGYDKGSAWLTTTDDLSGARDFAIDGNVFVLMENGIQKYTRGAREAFTLFGLDPELQNPSVIWTYNDVNNIYVLEPTNKRVIVFDKNGAMKAQYTADAWQNPTGMVVNEAEKTVFVLDANTVYQFQLTL